MYLAFQPRRCQVCNSRQARRCNVQQAALHKQTHRNCRRLPHGRYSFSPIRFDLRKDFKSLSPEALCSRQALTSGVWTAHLGRPTVGATRNKWRNRSAPGVRHHSSSFGSNSNDAGMYKACAKQQDVKAMARHRCIDRPPPARLEQTTLVNDFAHKERSGRPGRQVAPRRLDVVIACKVASMMLRTEDTAGLF